VAISREALVDFHGAIARLVSYCEELVWSLQSLSEDGGPNRYLLSLLGEIQVLYDELAVDEEIDSDNEEALRWFRVAHIQRHTALESIYETYVSYHDLAFGVCEDLVIAIHLSGYDPNNPDKYLISSDSIAEIAAKRPNILQDAEVIRVQLKAESALAVTLFSPNDSAAGERTISAQSIKKRYKPGNCPKCKSEKTHVNKTEKDARRLECFDCNHRWKVPS
jgi:hypothetical protein